MQAFADPRPAFHYYLRTRPQLEIHHTRGGNIQAQELAMFLRSQIRVSSANGDLLYDIRAAAVGSASLSPRTSPHRSTARSPYQLAQVPFADCPSPSTLPGQRPSDAHCN